jgi:peptidoglycan/LPS O-acetylase OafA/YrhL
MTSMRGVAAALVVSYHMRDSGRDSFVLAGYLWVDFFFILSGFILAYVYGQLFSASLRARDYLSFLTKRIARIYPLHLFMLLAYVGSGIVGLDAATGGRLAVATHVLLIHAWGIHDDLTWNRVSWSISAEWAFYLVFPFIAWVVLRASRLLLWTLPLALLGALVLLTEHAGTLGVTYDLALLRCIPEATLGVLLFRASQADCPWLRRIAQLDWVRWPVVLLPFVLMQVKAHEVAIVAAMALMILPLSIASGSLHRVLAWRPLHHLGVVSYSLYMSHYLVLIFTRKLVLHRFHLDPKRYDLGTIQLVLVHLGFIGLCTAVATVLYRLVEVPGRRALNRCFAARTGMRPG